MSVAKVMIAAAVLMVGSTAPSIVVGVHVLSVPIGYEQWTFAVPFGLAGLVGVLGAYEVVRGRSISTLPFAWWVLLMFLALALLSSSWSVSPTSTGLRAVTAVGIAGFGFWFGTSFRFREQLVAVAVVTSTTAVASVALIIFYPGIGRPLSRAGEQWIGVFAGANTLGPMSALGLLAAYGVYRSFNSMAIRLAAVLVAILHAVLLVRADSATAQFGVVGVLATLGAVRGVHAARRRGMSGSKVAIISCVLAGGALAILIATMKTLATAVGSDPTLSSRTLIWSDVVDAIQERPFQGYGFWAYWDNLDYSWVSYRDIGRWYGSAHNSMLEALLGLGVVGGVLLATLVVVAVVNRARSIWVDDSLASQWWAALLAFLLVEHSMESLILGHSIFWMLLVSAVFVPLACAVDADCGSAVVDRRADASVDDL